MSLLVLLLIISCWTPVEPTCLPLREGQPGTLSCRANQVICPDDNLLVWKAGEKPVARCVPQGCNAGYSVFSATIDSTLTIKNVSRTDPFDMEVEWECEKCRGVRIIVCSKLEVYALPENPSCTVREDTESGDIKSVTVFCSTSKVYPKARCEFYRGKTRKQPVTIPNPVYSHTPTGETPVYYRSHCSVTVSVQELGEGTHRFIGYISPGVRGRLFLQNRKRAYKTVTLSFSQASHSCRPQAVQGYFLEESTTCTCSLISDGHPRGRAKWYKGDQLVESDGILVVTRDKSNPKSVQASTCEAVSDLGRRLGSTLRAKFASPLDGPFCTVREDTESGDIKSVNISCSTSTVYPKARCTFYRVKDMKLMVTIPNPVYSHTPTGETPVYHRFQCSVTVSVQELGEGTHRFTVRIYSDVRGDPAKVTGALADKTVTLSFSQASHRCEPGAVGGYFLEKSTTCTCSFSSDGHPRGTAQWYKGDQLVGSGGTLVVSRDMTNPESVQTYTCEAVSDLGRRLGSTLKAKFALDASAHVESIVNKDDSLNNSYIVIGVIAVVIIAVLIVVIIFLVKKIRESKPQSLLDDDYLVPLEMSTITSHVSANIPPRPGQYRTVDDIPVTTDTTPVSARLPPRPGQYETIDDIPATSPVSATLPPETAQYETIQDMATISRTYISSSQQDVEALNVCQDLEPLDQW